MSEFKNKKKEIFAKLQKANSISFKILKKRRAALVLRNVRATILLGKKIKKESISLRFKRLINSSEVRLNSGNDLYLNRKRRSSFFLKAKKSNKYRVRTRRSWKNRFYYRSLRLKTALKSMYRGQFWGEYQQFQLGLELIKLGYDSNSILAIKNLFLEQEAAKKREIRQLQIKSISKLARKEGSSQWKGHSKKIKTLRVTRKGTKESRYQGYVMNPLSQNFVKKESIKRYNTYHKLKVKWSLREGLDGRCYITQTRNNLFVVLMCDKSSKVLMELSAGKLGYKGAAKRTRLVAVQLGKRIGNVSYLQNYRKLTVYLRGRISMLVRGVVQGLRLEQVNIRRLVYVREIAHNGVRLRKSRRM